MSAKTAKKMHNLSEYSLKDEFKHERQIAKELFSISTGKVNDDDPFLNKECILFKNFYF